MYKKRSGTSHSFGEEFGDLALIHDPHRQRALSQKFGVARIAKRSSVCVIHVVLLRQIWLVAAVQDDQTRNDIRRSLDRDAMDLSLCRASLECSGWWRVHSSKSQ